MSEPTVAPYGTWRSPISAAMLVEGGVRLSHVSIEEGSVYWVEGRPAEGGRSVVVRRDPGSEADGRHARRLQRAHHRARVRGRRVRGASWRRLLLELRRSTALSPGARRRAGADHARHGGSFPVRGRSRDGGRVAPDLRPRAARGGGRRQRARGHPHGRLERRLDRRGRLRLLLHAADLSRRDEARVAGVEPPLPAVGRFRAVGGGSRPRRRRLRSSPGRRQARGRVDLPTGVEPGRRPALRLGPHRTGGTSTARSTATCRRSARWTRSSDGRSGCSGSPRTRSSTTGASRASGTATEHSTSP